MNNMIPFNPQYADELQRKSSEDPQNISDMELRHLYHMIRPQEQEPVQESLYPDLEEVERIKSKGMSLGEILRSKL